jgi:hypothetical protein
MSKFFKNFLSNVGGGLTNPKGNLGDFRHASKLFVDSNYRLAPKQKFLYHVVFNIHPVVKSRMPFIGNNITALNMLVKSVDLPKYKIATDLAFQYNRKKQVHTKIEYEPVTLILYDDNLGVSTNMWASYYGYYFADSSHGGSAGSMPNVGSSGGITPFAGLSGLKNLWDNVKKIPGTLVSGIGGLFKKGTNVTGRGGGSDPATPVAYQSNAVDPTNLGKFRFGLDNGSSVPFFTSVQIFQLSRKSYQCFTLVNPKIVSFQHDNLQYAEGAATTQNTMSLVYEGVIYGVGAVKQGIPTGFGTEYYDKVSSPLSLLGGGTKSLFGQGGVLGGVGSILGDLSNPDTFTNPGALFGTLVKGANTFKNAKELSSKGIQAEGFGIIKSAIGSATGIDVSGVANVAFPKEAGRGQNQTTSALAPKESVRPQSLTASEQSAINDNPVALSTLVSKATTAGVVPAGPNAESQVKSLMASGRNLKLNSLAQKVVADVKG